MLQLTLDIRPVSHSMLASIVNYILTRLDIRPVSHSMLDERSRGAGVAVDIRHQTSQSLYAG